MVYRAFGFLLTAALFLSTTRADADTGESSPQPPRCYRQALPEAVLDMLSADIKTLENADMFGGTKYFWVPIEQLRRPRNVFEVAVALLQSFAFPAGNGGVPGGIVGAEWWANVDDPASDEDSRMHVDKDEGAFEQNHTYDMPILSTVTYMSDIGAPTLILNQTVCRGQHRFARSEKPELPTEGFLVYPARNRHLVFESNLVHGIAHSLSSSDDSKAQRITFLVNWWHMRPNRIYCASLSDRVASNLAPGVHAQAAVDTLWNQLQSVDHSMPIGEPLVALNVGPGLNRSTGRRIDVSHDTRQFNFPFPAANDPGVFHIRWPASHVLGGFDHVRLGDGVSSWLLEHSQMPLIAVFLGKDSSGQVGIDSRFLFPLTKAFRSRARLLLFDPVEDSSLLFRLLSTYGLGAMTSSRVPAVVILEPKEGMIVAADEGRGVGAMLHGFPSYKHVRRWVEKYFADRDSRQKDVSQVRPDGEL